MLVFHFLNSDSGHRSFTRLIKLTVFFNLLGLIIPVSEEDEVLPKFNSGFKLLRFLMNIELIIISVIVDFI